MADPYLAAYTADHTLIATLTAVTKQGGSSFQWRPREDGSAQFTAKGSISAAALAETAYVRVNDGTTDVFAFVPTKRVRRATDNPGESEVDLSGPGLRALLHAGQVLQEDTSDCAEPASERWVGPMSAVFDHSSWDAAVSWGAFYEGPFTTVRPDGWFDPLAEFITPTASAVTPRTWHAWREFTVAADIDVIAGAAADDSYRLFLDGSPLFDTLNGGAFQWRRFQQKALSICAGTHTLYAEVVNAERAAVASNGTWLLATLLPANTATGKPEAHNQVWAIFTDHSSGTFTISTIFGATTASIDVATDNAADIEAALEALSIIGTGNVSVSGGGVSGDPWLIEFVGDLANLEATPLTVDGPTLSGGTAINVVEYVRGGFADPVVRTDTDWTVLDDPATPPGLNPYQILDTLMDEIAARGSSPVDDFTLGCTLANDSAGNAWSQTVTMPIPLSADLHDVARMLDEVGFQVDVDPDGTIQVWNPGGRGTDLSASVTITEHSSTISNLAAGEDRTGLANAVRVRTDEGWHWATDATSITARGRWESGITIEGFPSAADSEPVTDGLLDELGVPPRTTTLDVPSEATGIVPFVDFDRCDIITAPAFSRTADTFDAVDMRFVSVTGRIVEKSMLYSIELVD